MKGFDDYVIPEPNTGCHLWTGWLNQQGSGNFQAGPTWAEKKLVRAHRYAYERVHGPIPAGMECCHTCDVRSCVNPDHLFIGTKTDNMQDAKAKGRLRSTLASLNRVKTHCLRGHEFTPENTVIGISRGTPARRCRACARRRMLEQVERRRILHPPKWRYGTETHCWRGHDRGTGRNRQGKLVCLECARQRAEKGRTLVTLRQAKGSERNGE